MTEGPLAGLRVIDQTQALAGPYCTMMLGDLGADVIKIERPGIGDQSRQWGPPYIGDQSTYYLSVNRNKRSIALNIASQRGQEILHRLIDSADIFMTNLATRASLAKYKIDYPTLSSRNPQLIYASISGYGRKGPRADQPGYDLVAQAESGTMSLTGEPDGAPMRFLSPMADMTCGLFTLIGIQSALRVREDTGRGQFIDQSLQEGQLTWLENYAGEYFATQKVPMRMGNRHPQIAPYEAVQGSDGDWFILGVGSDNVWRSFCSTIGKSEWAEDAKFAKNADRVANYDLTMKMVREIVSKRPTSEWLPLLRAGGVPAGRINNIEEAFSDENVQARDMVITLEHPNLGELKSIATPIKLEETPLVYHRHPPELGENTREILNELNIRNTDIEELYREGTVA